MLLPLALLLACTTPTPPAEPAPPPPQAQPAPTPPPADPAPTPPPADPGNDMPQSWRRLVDRDGRLVDYRWCNADPVEVHLPAPGEDQLRWQWGQEEELLTVRKVTWTEAGARWEVDRGGTSATVTLTWTDKARGLATIGLGEPVGETFVDQARLADFPQEAEEHCDEL